ncbi:MAG: universal stress protein, partial [Aeromicrobium sp.]
MLSKRLERPIVVGVDVKQQAALRYALDEAKSQGCGVRVVHAYSLSATGPALLSGEMMDAAAESAYQILDAAREFVESQKVKVPVEYVVEFGSATQTLENESISARSLVLGPENASWYERILAGEVGSWLATRAQCPVIVVPDHWS